MKNSSVPSPFSLYRFGILAALLAATFFLLHAAGCKTTDQKTSSSAEPAKNSTITVRTESDGIHIQSAAAEFVLTPSGYLKSSLKLDGRNVTLDDTDNASGQSLTAAHQHIDDIVLDLKTARISEAQGKLGRLGKQVEVSGAGKSANLKETLALEVYDDFPALALLSASLRNDGEKEISLENVSLQEHRLNASLVDGAAAPHEMWSFFGSSLKWGKDDVLPIPAKFEQQNPFGAPVDYQGRLGSRWRRHSGGGVLDANHGGSDWSY